ncbi:MAG: hypothetical protein LBS90_05255 [Oscillospiraceae bacterium]|nr:hypothetical protein [Oscillospiraceae bacterium]
MKKILALLMVLMLVLASAACAKDAADPTASPSADPSADTSTEPTADPNAKSDGVLTYAEYAAAALDTEVAIEAYVQAKQIYSSYGNTTLYLQDADGAYFIYRINCSQDEYDTFAIGSKLKITGYKAEWGGEIEIIDATYEVGEGSYTAPAVDLSDVLGTDALVDYQNRFFTIKGLTVETTDDGATGGDLYIDVSLNGTTFTLAIETDLTDAASDVYAAAKGLAVGDKIDIEGFLFWYEGAPNPHVTSVVPAV